MIHGPQQGVFDLSFALPSACADRLADGTADIGIVPVIEVPRLGLEIAPGAGIACRGAVRSILLISKVPIRAIRTLATDTSSRTSVQLARIVLDRKYGVRPALVPIPPELAVMLGAADAALVIGDPALHIDPAALPFETLDLGAEWHEMTGLPFVFAAWAGRPEVMGDGIAAHFVASCRYGLRCMEKIVRQEAPRRGLPDALVHHYLKHSIVFELGPAEYEGMRLFLEYAGYQDSLRSAGTIAV